MLDIRRYFGRRSNDNRSTEVDEEMTREVPMQIRGDSPRTTSFNRKLVIGLAGLFTLIFAFSMLYGMSKPAPDNQKQEAEVKDKKIATIPQNNSQLDKLPSSYEGRNQNIGAANPKTESLKTENIPERPPIPEDFSLPKQPVNRNSTPPIPTLPPGAGGLQWYSDVMPALPAAAVPTVSKEEQELADARKSPIRFNLK